MPPANTAVERAPEHEDLEAVASVADEHDRGRVADRHRLGVEVLAGRRGSAGPVDAHGPGELARRLAGALLDRAGVDDLATVAAVRAP